MMNSGSVDSPNVIRRCLTSLQNFCCFPCVGIRNSSEINQTHSSHSEAPATNHAYVNTEFCGATYNAEPIYEIIETRERYESILLKFAKSESSQHVKSASSTCSHTYESAEGGRAGYEATLRTLSGHDTSSLFENHTYQTMVSSHPPIYDIIGSRLENQETPRANAPSNPPPVESTPSEEPCCNQISQFRTVLQRVFCCFPCGNARDAQQNDSTSQVVSTPIYDRIICANTSAPAEPRRMRHAPRT